MINLGRTRRWAAREGAVGRAIAALTKRTVTGVRQSPMNAMRWSVDLSCGHDVWVTAKKRPKAKAMTCPKCAPPTEREPTPMTNTKEP